ncbi:DUF4126 domain-containing protein [Lipingzhangella sp. LS1_29]|uniref:DUF4126 domain-containing protein n=1 Tax=Lipingzhangella rawalii TaxID=2055835 RepID=A0ABU2H9K3_9ACTN|nr:DUF4126 domain-containing protein [Lipingzhangella rawalii]MDS1271992.1 DUF4126 domain-containing protein [Lipingzhangella rawalii]
MTPILVGLGLSAAAGLNAYIPLLLLGLVARYGELLPLPESWQWLESPVMLGVLGVLLLLELVADKVPGVDTVNDLVQTVVRPTSGGITFGAGASAATVDGTPESGSLGPVVAGVLVALALHGVKSLARPALNTLTLGTAGVVVSTVEDAASLTLTLVALLIPILIVVAVPVLVLLAVWAVRRGRTGRRRSRRGRGGGAGESPNTAA